MDNEMRAQFRLIMQGMADMESRIEQKIKESETKTQIYIENQVSKRIDALFDGYKLTHEKQWELERKVSELENRLEKLENAG